MKKLSIVMMLVLAGCWLTGCVSNQIDPPTAVDQANAESIGNPYLITEEEALANLEAFFAVNNQGQTRTSTPMPRIKRITGVRNHDRATRGETGDSTILLYIANFDDEQGFALLSADKRVSSLVVGVSEKGEISEEILEYYDRLISDRPLYKGFPLDGPGFFTDTIPGGGTETFINPNTVDFYIEKEDDYLIGNLDTSGYELLNQYAIGNGDSGNRITLDNQLQLLILEYAVNYAKNCIKGINVNDNKMTDKPVGVWDPVPGGSPTNDGTETNVVVKGPLLSKFVEWRQSPYLNKSFKPVGDRDHALTGCYPLALAKILTYNCKPQIITYNDSTVHLDIIGNDIKGESPESARFLWIIAEWCDAKYFRNGTFVFPKKAKKFLSDCRYSNVKLKKYSFDRIKNMIDNNHPLAICGMPDLDLKRAHAWNIDGYRTSKRGINDIKMIHCDFGWGGNYNGYYVDNCFNLGSDDNIYDGRHENDDRTLNSYNRLLMYE